MNGKWVKKTSLLIVGTLMVLCLAGCGKQTVSTTEYLGTYSTDVTTLVPYNLPDTTGKKVISNVIDGLIETDKYGNYVPAIASSWEHNDDYTEWTFHLRDDCYWYDKNQKQIAPVTAQDFVDGLRFVADHKNTKSDMSIVKTMVVGLEKYYDDLVDFDDPNLAKEKKPKGTREELEASFDKNVGVKAVDESTVVYTLTQPVSYFESFLLTELFLPNHKEFSDACGKRFGTSVDKLLYCGAYVLTTWQRNKEFVMEKNKNYFDADKITVEKIILQKVSDASTVEMFKRGELTSTSLEGEQVEHYKNDETWGKYITLKEKSSVNYWFSMNFRSKNSEFLAFVQNEDFRKALYHALDRVTIAKLYNPYGAEEMLINTVCPQEVCIDENGVDYTEYAPLKKIGEQGAATYDPDQARMYFKKATDALVTSDGTINGAKAEEVKLGRQVTVQTDGKLPLQLVYIHGSSNDEVAMAQLIKLNFEEVFGKENVEVILGQYTGDKYNDVISPGHFDLCYDNFSFKYADPLAQLERLTTEGPINDGKYSIPEYDRLVEEGAKELIPSKRYEKFAQAEAMLIDGAYVIPWESGGGVYTMSREVPFTAPRGGFGLSRFKYKGVVLQKDPVTAEQYDELAKQFQEELKNQ